MHLFAGKCTSWNWLVYPDRVLFVSEEQVSPEEIKVLRSFDCLLVWMITVVYLNIIKHLPKYSIFLFADVCLGEGGTSRFVPID